MRESGKTGRLSRAFILAALTFALMNMAGVLCADAGIIVTAENQPGTAWPHADPTIYTNGSNLPSAFGSGIGIGAAPGSNIGQTFTVTSTFTLGRIDMAYRTSQASGTVGVRIQEANVVLNGEGTNYVYDVGANLLSDNLTFTFTVETGSTTGVLTLDLTGTDQITLQAGKVYSLEFYNPASTTTTVGFNYVRRGADTYSGGMAFQNRLSVNGIGTRDAAVQLFAAVPEPATLALLAFGGLMMCHRRRA